jgi:hypothetical protein
MGRGALVSEANNELDLGASLLGYFFSGATEKK